MTPVSIDWNPGKYRDFLKIDRLEGVFLYFFFRKGGRI